MPQLIFYIFVAIISVILEIQRTDRSREVSSDEGLIGWITKKVSRRNRRIDALKNAQMYLKPYENIFGNLTLSNKYCTLSLSVKDKRILCMSSVYDENGKKMIVIAKNFSPMDIDEYFDMICGIFTFSTKYNDVLYSLKTTAIILESVLATRPSKSGEVPVQTFETLSSPKYKEYETIDIDINSRDFLDTASNLTDINNCSEAELTALPGISIIAAKKIIKFRDTQRPFKSVEDFITVMQIKPHFAKQLRKLVCANKVNMKKVRKAKAERIIDL